MISRVKHYVINSISQGADKIGYATAGSGVGLGVYGRMTPQEYVASLVPMSLTDWAAVFSIVLTIVLIIKNIREILGHKKKDKGNADDITD